MKFKGCKLTLRKRRGLSSVVGALLFVVLMVATFAVLGVALNSQADIVSTGRDVADTGLKKQQEEFTLRNIIQLPGGFLQVNLTNQGQNPAEIFTMIMTNKTDAGVPTKTFEIPSNTSFLPPRGDDEQTNIVNTLDLEMDIPVTGSEFYDFKVISSLGTIKRLGIECKAGGLCGPSVPTVDSGDLQAQLFLDGPNGINTKTSTVVLFVQNQGSNSVFNVSPINDCLAMTTTPPLPSVSTFDPCVLDSPDPFSELLPGSTAIFKWDGTVNAEIDETFVFCNGGGGFESDLVTPVADSNVPCDLLTVIDPNDCGGCGPGGDTFILLDDLLIRPSLWMIIPSPFGLAVTGDGAIWGVNVVNPTEKSMSVTKVTIVSYPPGANANHLVIDPNACNLVPITPTTDWSCPGENTIMWQNAVGIEIPPWSAQEMLVTVEPGSIAGSIDLDALIVQANAFTTAGSFGKSGYQTTMYDDQEVMANVFLTDADLSVPEDPTDITHIISKREGIQDLIPYELKVTLADMDEDDNSFIKAGSNIVINVPREWTDVTITGEVNFEPDGGTTAPDDDRITPFTDGSTQIIVTTKVDIGGNVDGDNLQDHLTLTFTATPPDNEGEPFKPYIMFVFAYGESGNCIANLPDPCIPTPRQIGPLSEIFLQVKD